MTFGLAEADNSVLHSLTDNYSWLLLHPLFSFLSFLSSFLYPFFSSVFLQFPFLFISHTGFNLCNFLPYLPAYLSLLFFSHSFTPPSPFSSLIFSVSVLSPSTVFFPFLTVLTARNNWLSRLLHCTSLSLLLFFFPQCLAPSFPALPLCRPKILRQNLPATLISSSICARTHKCRE